MSKPICGDCVAEVQLFKWCQNLSAGTVLQRCSCLSGVKTYLRALCCRGAAVKVVSKPICLHCVAEVQLFKQCRNLSARHCEAWLQLFKRCCNLSAGILLQGCSCLSGVKTYLRAMCCRGAADKVVSKPTCPHCVEDVQLFKQCRNLTAGHCSAGVQLFKRCRNTSAGTVLQGCSCLGGAKTYLPGQCCRGAAV